MSASKSKAVKSIAGGGVLATALLALTGVPAHATPLLSCDGITTIPATEDALRAAIAGTDAVICIDPGTIDFSNGVDLTDGPIDIARDVAIIGVGAVTFEGGNDTSFLTTLNASALTVTVQNITFQNGYTSEVTLGSAIDFSAAGTLTVLNSTFTGNGGFGAALAGKNHAPSLFAPQPAIVVDNSLFSSNGSATDSGNGGAIFAYGDLTVTNSTFLNNSSSTRGGAIVAEAALTVQANLFANNFASDGGGAINVVGGGPTADISNNTFVNNQATNLGGAVIVERDANFAYNTFVDNVAGTSGNALFKNSIDSVILLANIFASSTDAAAAQIGEETPGGASPYADFGANISTSAADAANALNNSNAIPGHVGAPYLTLALSPLADNGGLTQTVALNAGSIAIDAATPEIRVAATAITQPTTDARGVSRGDDTVASDAGAYEYVAPITPVDPVIVPPELAKSGFSSGAGIGSGLDANASIALAGAALLGGAALVSGATLRNRRRQR
jgi:predicted outer membrane repeat protein